MKFFVVVPNWNGEDFLQQCIDSLLSQKQACNIVVVENGSVDSSDKILDSYSNKITVLKQNKNLGFAGGVNVGIEYAINNGATYVALFNNDAIADENWLKNLVDNAENDINSGIVTCKFLHQGDNKLDSTGDFYTTYGLPYPRGRGQIDSGQFDSETKVFGATGGASLYRVEMLNQIGLFDNDYFAYFEDVDISFRAQLAGWQVKYEPKAIAYHHIGGTSSKINGFAVYQTAKNFWFMYVKNMPGVLFWKYLFLANYWYCRMFVARIVKGGFWPFVKGWFAGLVLLPKKIGERRQIQKNRKVTVNYIDSILIHARPPKIGK